MFAFGIPKTLIADKREAKGEITPLNPKQCLNASKALLELAEIDKALPKKVIEKFLYCSKLLLKDSGDNTIFEQLRSKAISAITLNGSDSFSIEHETGNIVFTTTGEDLGSEEDVRIGFFNEKYEPQKDGSFGMVLQSKGKIQSWFAIEPSLDEKNRVNFTVIESNQETKHFNFKWDLPK